MGNPIATAFAKQFEPILLFHPDEQLFPIDPKWYLERCALWRSEPSSDDQKNWGEPPRSLPTRSPQFQKNEIAALKNETAGGRTWLGANPGTPSAFLVGFQTASLPQQAQVSDRFLQFLGWENAVPPDEVTTTSENRHATLDPSQYAAAAGSRFWYYAEYLDNNALKDFAKDVNVNGFALSGVVADQRMGQPQALLFHLFYPFHEEPLQGCESTDNGPTFGTFAGEWACVAILLDSTGGPLYIGLTSRNVGEPTSTIAQEDGRIGMLVEEWGKVATIDSGKEMHPKIFVSRGTHGNYLTSGAHSLKPFTPGGIDLTTQSCGAIETLDDVIYNAPPGKPGQPGKDSEPLISATKLLSSFLLGGLGAFVGAIYWSLGEGAYGSFGTGDEPGPVAMPVAQPQDQTGNGSFGKIIRPKGLAFDETSLAPPGGVVDWDTRLIPATETPDGRVYDFIVDRDTGGQQPTGQVWWAPRQRSRGFAGRWGPQVTHDPNSRRSGMRCPDFLVLFLESIARKLAI